MGRKFKLATKIQDGRHKFKMAAIFFKMQLSKTTSIFIHIKETKKKKGLFDTFSVNLTKISLCKTSYGHLKIDTF